MALKKKPLNLTKVHRQKEWVTIIIMNNMLTKNIPMYIIWTTLVKILTVLNTYSL